MLQIIFNNKSSMNPKAKRYFQEMNKQNMIFRPLKQEKNKQYRFVNSKIFGSNSKNHLHPKNKQEYSSKRNIKEFKQMIKFPKINHNKENKQARMIKQYKDSHASQVSRVSPPKKHSKSVKKLVTEPSQCQFEKSYTRTLSPTHNDMKDAIGRIMRIKENGHMTNIDEEIDKVEDLRRRYSFLRKDLVAIQEDILTISLKQKFKGRKESSHSEIVLF